MVAMVCSLIFVWHCSWFDRLTTNEKPFALSLSKGCCSAWGLGPEFSTALRCLKTANPGCRKLGVILGRYLAPGFKIPGLNRGIAVPEDQ
jgi:hypothetical protein